MCSAIDDPSMHDEKPTPRKKPIRVGDEVVVTMRWSGDLGTHPENGRTGRVERLWAATPYYRRRADVVFPNGDRRTIATDTLDRVTQPVYEGMDDYGGPAKAGS